MTKNIKIKKIKYLTNADLSWNLRIKNRSVSQAFYYSITKNAVSLIFFYYYSDSQ